MYLPIYAACLKVVLERVEVNRRELGRACQPWVRLCEHFFDDTSGLGLQQSSKITATIPANNLTEDMEAKGAVQVMDCIINHILTFMQHSLIR